MEEIKIELDKTKVYPGTILLLLLTGLALWELLIVNKIDSIWIISTNMIIPGLVLCILLSGIFSILLIRKLLDSKPGLTIGEKGLIDNSTILPIGWINWKEIDKIRVQRIGIYNHILIEVNNPMTYIDKEKNFIKRVFMKMNYNKYKTPIMIPFKVLKYDDEKLIEILTDKMEKFRTKAKHIV